jgi:prolyl-tRNA synthetase
MFWSKSFIPTLKETPESAESISHRLMLRAGLVRMLIAGVYSYLPLGLKVLKNIQDIIRSELDSIGAQELLLPCIQPLDLWIKTKRDVQLGDTLIRFKDRRKRQLCLGPTHEEVITSLVKGHIFSYRQLPLILYQIQTKFRDEPRLRFGLVRSCEFIMKDAYSFDRNEEGLDRNYRLMYDCYCRIFKRMGLNFKVIRADPGIMGGQLSEEFMAPSESGEDKIDGATFVEIGHIFKLGTKYSQVLGVNFSDEDSKLHPVVMGCYGIGVSRLISAIIEQNHDSEGIIWPKEVAPYKVIISPLDITEKKIMDTAERLYHQLNQRNIEVLLDDRDERAGVKFKDADLIGIPLRVVISKDTLKNDKFEIKQRSTQEVSIVEAKYVLRKIEDLLENTRN